MKRTVSPTIKMTGHSVTRINYGTLNRLSMDECRQGYSGNRPIVLTRDTVCNLDPAMVPMLHNEWPLRVAFCQGGLKQQDALSEVRLY